MNMEMRKNTGVAILVPDKVNFKTKKDLATPLLGIYPKKPK